MPRKKQSGARLDKAAVEADLAGPPQPTYSVATRDLTRFPIKPPPKRPSRSVGVPPTRWVLLADAHFPFVDAPTWDVVKQAILDLRPTGIVIMGDWNDFASISQHERSIEATNRGLDLLTEFGAGDYALDELDAVATEAWFRRFLRGNHEWRVDRYLVSPLCPGAVRALVPSVPQGLHLAQRGYEYVEQKPTSLGTGDLMFLHGHFYNRHHASKHLESLHASCVYGHTHMPQQATHSVPLEGTQRRTLVATGLPTMRDLKREWHEEERVHTWVNGFGVVEFSAKTSSVYNVYVIDGAAAYGGFSWQAKVPRGG